MAKLTVAGQPVRLGSHKVIGQGGEATVYRLDKQTALKLYKTPNDPDYATNAQLQKAAKSRLAEYQRKLPVFPAHLPAEVVAPVELAYTGSEIAGFTMPYMHGMEVLMQYGARAWRESSGIDTNHVVALFRELHRVVRAVHATGVVIGDFNDLNVLSDGQQVRLIDADSMQFGGFVCQTYTTRFLDPRLTDGTTLQPVRPHDMQSDWYAYFVMLIQSLLYVGPYGGVHRPKQGRRLQHDERVLQRLTFLDSDVIYPKPALSFGILPDELQAYFQAVTSRDMRGELPHQLLDGLRFTTCSSCGATHARPTCPQCQAPGIVRQTVTVRGTVKATRVFRTKGKIVQAAVQHGRLHYLYEEKGALYREGDRRLMQATLSPELRFRLRGEQTLIARGQALLTVDPDGSVTRGTVDCYRERLPMFDTTADASLWLQNGQLLQSGRLSPLYLGDVLPAQTLFWAGERLGFGLYQAGQIARAFVFRPGVRGLNDQVDIGTINGQLVDATCALSDTHVWFFTTTQESGSLLNRVWVIDASGQLVAESVATDGDDSWLGQGIRGHFAVGPSLFAATDDGLVRVTTSGGSVARERQFPDTTPFVSSGNWLLPGAGGIYVVSHRDITLLTIK